ncbi:MAG: tetratricopeptide repeat protein [Chthoniobacterales bacterium]
MKAPVGTTFVVAASLLGAAAVAQLVAVLVYFGPGLGQPAVTAPIAVATPPPTPEPPPAPEATPEPPVIDEKAAQQTADDAARIAELLKESEKLEGGSSPTAAVVPLEEAVALQPRNPEVLARLAGLQERAGQKELAETTWKTLIELGPDAGRFLDVADIRLRLLKQEGAVPPGGSEVRDQVGLQPGSTLGVIDLQLKDSAPNGKAVKDLRLAIKARPGERVDASDVRINVTFYEKVNGEVVPTMSRVQSMWFTTPVDWKEEGIEILEVKYEVPRIGSDGGPPPNYYGYMVNIYHRGQLQDTRADPVDLQERFPPPLNEAAENAPR